MNDFDPMERPYKRKGRVFSKSRRAVLELLDCIMEDHHNIQKLGDKLQEEFDNNPVKFMQQVIMPTITPNMLIDNEGTEDTAAEVRNILKGMDDAQEGPPVEIVEPTKTETA